MKNELENVQVYIALFTFLELVTIVQEKGI